MASSFRRDRPSRPGGTKRARQPGSRRNHQVGRGGPDLATTAPPTPVSTPRARPSSQSPYRAHAGARREPAGARPSRAGGAGAAVPRRRGGRPARRSDRRVGGQARVGQGEGQALRGERVAGQGGVADRDDVRGRHRQGEARGAADGRAGGQVEPAEQPTAAGLRDPVRQRGGVARGPVGTDPADGDPAGRAEAVGVAVGGGGQVQLSGSAPLGRQSWRPRSRCAAGGGRRAR